jgi:predicted nucleic acid-binding protein
VIEIVIDASAVLAWCFEDEIDVASRSLLEQTRHAQLFVPSLFHVEVANVLAAAERRGRISGTTRVDFVGFISGLRITVDETTWLRAFSAVMDLAQRERLTAYDAAYQDLAHRLDIPLATRDEALKRAAGRIGVLLAPA